MSTGMKRFLYWSPRVLCLMFCAFLGVFAIDVFEQPGSAWAVLAGLTIHLIPVFGMIAVLVLAWHREWLAAALFTGLALLYASDAWGQEHWTAVAAISGSLLLLGVLFLLSWIFRRQLASR